MNDNGIRPRGLFLVIFVMLLGAGSLFPKEGESKTMSNHTTIRKPAVAGSFYPADPNQIRAQVTDYLSRTGTDAVPGHIFGLVAPHAGYIYSGQIAAEAYRLLKGQQVSTAIVISPSHVEYFPFASVFDGDGYETPLGVIPVNQALAERICADQDFIKRSPRGHLQEHLSRQEHALEVQLPFLQCVLAEAFTIVPVVMGDQTWEACEALARAIAPVLDDAGVVVIASSDLSHFHSGDEARRLDAEFSRHLERMEMEQLYNSIQKKTSEACGAGPVIATVLAGRAAGAFRCSILATATSGDVTNDHGSVVGYLSAALTGEPARRETKRAPAADQFELTPEERSFLLALARHSIASRLDIESTAPAPITSNLLDQKSGAFVTIKVAGRLRGCIGYIEAHRPMREAIEEMAKAAAFNDPRFHPLTSDEYPAIALEISVLSPLRRITDVEEIVVGRHGLVIEQGSSRGLLLPQVATEYGWDRTQFLEHTCQKAMLPKDAWQDASTKIYLFSAEVFGEHDGGE